MKAYFIRHGQTNYNLIRYCNNDPSRDVHLTDLWKQQAASLIPFFKWKVLDKVYTSNLPRAQETARISLSQSIYTPEVEPRINDRITGFDGRSADEFWTALWPDILNAKIPGCESFQDVKLRVHSFLDDLSKKKDHFKEICAVTHTEIMKIITGYYEWLSDMDTWNLQIEQCKVLEIDI